MKNIVSFKICIYLAVLQLLTSACNKEFDNGDLLDNKNTIKDKIDTDSNFSFFKELYQYHDSVTSANKPSVITVGTRIPTVGGTLASEGITAYIPTNDVFIANGVDFVKRGGLLNSELLKIISMTNNYTDNELPVNLLTQFLGNLINSRNLETSDFESLTRLKSLGGNATDSLFINEINGQIILNSKAVLNISSKATLKNGNLYTINDFIRPVFNGNFLQAIAVDTSLSLFNQAIVRANNPVNALINASANTANIMATVFAPTNQAFKDAGITSANINSMTLASLQLLVQNHIIRSRIFSQNLVSGNLGMVNSRQITVNVGSTAVTITSPGSVATPATVINTDNLVVRGVIHKIDKVLKP